MWGIDFCKFRLPSNKHNDQDCKRHTHCRLAIEHVLFREKENPMEEEEMHWKIDIHCSSGYGRLLDGNSRPKEDVYNGRESQGRSGRWRVLTV